MLSLAEASTFKGGALGSLPRAGAALAAMGAGSMRGSEGGVDVSLGPDATAPFVATPAAPGLTPAPSTWPARTASDEAAPSLDALLPSAMTAGAGGNASSSEPRCAGTGRATPGSGRVAAAFGARAFSTCFGGVAFGPSASGPCRVAVGPTSLLVSCRIMITPPSTSAASASIRRPREPEAPLTMAPGGTESELGFCAGVSSLLAGRRSPPGGVPLRESRERTLDALDAPLDRPASGESGAGGADECRATTSAGDSSPV
jgi:hypothetical protein